MSDLNSRVAALALEQVGVHEGENHTTPYGAWTASLGGPPNGIDKAGKKVAWCGAFVSWLWYTASEGKIAICSGMRMGKGEVFQGGCTWIPTILAWAEKTGRWLDASEEAQPGDLIVFQLPGTKHVGIVVARDPDADNDVICVEGNYSSGVHKTSYQGDDERILGYVRVG